MAIQSKSDKEAEIDDTERRIRSQISLHGFDTDQSFDTIEGEAIHDVLKEKQEIMLKEADKLSLELEASQQKFASFQGTFEVAKQSLKEKQRYYDSVMTNINRNLSKIEGEVNLTNVDSVEEVKANLEEAKTKLEHIQAEIASGKSSENMYKSFIEVMEKKGPRQKDKHSGCPLCERPFQSENERSRVVTSIQTQLSSQPEHLHQLKKEEAATRTRVNSLAALLPLFVDRTRVGEEISQLKNQVENGKLELEPLKNEIDRLKRDSENKKKLINEISKLVNESQQLGKIWLEMFDMDDKITRFNEEKEQITGGAAGCMSADEISANLEQKRIDLKHTEEQLRLLEKRRSDYSKEVDRCRDRCMQLKQAKIEIDSKQQKRCQMESDRDRIAADLQRLKDSSSKCRIELEPLRAKINELERERKSLREKHNVQLEELSIRSQMLRDGEQRLATLDEDIRKTKQQSKLGGIGTIEDRYEELDGNFNKILEEIDVLNENLRSVSENINQLKLSDDNQKAFEREVTDAIAYQEKKAELKPIQERKFELEQRMKKLLGAGSKSLRHRQADLKNQESEFLSEKISSDAHVNALAEKLKESKDSLERDYKDADKKFRDKKAELKIHMMANEDLKAYYRLVDKALLTFHTRKMTEINKIIGNLLFHLIQFIINSRFFITSGEIWQQTYKGGDIDTIEIQSDVETVGSEASKRRTYNYRVVMKKNDTSMDMRGRCSAGQKVLASIIIRLALSEAFAGKCHVLALDEPTTNLDRENVSF